MAAARERYRLTAWTSGYFDIDDHGVVVACLPGAATPLPLAELVAAVRGRGISGPILLRLQDILRDRVVQLNQHFRAAIEAADYPGIYRSLYPVKVNQLREVVEEVLEAGAPFGLGLECGSQPELLAALAYLPAAPGGLMVCNGVKDDAMLQLILDAQGLGLEVLPVIEKPQEYLRLLALAAGSATRRTVGVRIRLNTRGKGRWEASGGSRSKFGLGYAELGQLLTALDAPDCPLELGLLHFHVGSQVSDVQVLRQAVKEASRLYVALRQRGHAIRYLDVGGGLGVSYTQGGSDPDHPDYGLAEYANTVVYTVAEVCREAGVPAPTLLSESGRAMTAHHSLLVVEVQDPVATPRLAADGSGATHGSALAATRLAVSLEHDAPADTTESLTEAWHDLLDHCRDVESAFMLGYASLADQATCETALRQGAQAIDSRVRSLDRRPPELAGVADYTTEDWLANFSVFQSVLDHWAIDQVFPVLPLTGHQQPAGARVRVVDLTCDSDGCLTRYVCQPEDALTVPARNGPPPDIAIFMLGAYQDILGDAHNLFGRVAEAHIYADAEEPGGFYIEKLIAAEQAGAMLASVQYFRNDLERRIASHLQQAVDAGHLSTRAGVDWLARYGAMLDRHTYCQWQVPAPGSAPAG